MTYKPPAFSLSVKGPVPRRPTEDEYLTALYNPHRARKFDESPPVESYLVRELANPHSRAKKHQRWKIWQAAKQKLFADLMIKETANLNGRTTREARAEAAFKWRRQIEEQKEEQRKRRWKHKASAANMERQTKRRERKEMKQRQRLTALVLKEEPNQVIPKDVHT